MKATGIAGSSSSGEGKIMPWNVLVISNLILSGHRCRVNQVSRCAREESVVMVNPFGIWLVYRFGSTIAWFAIYSSRNRNGVYDSYVDKDNAV